MTKNYPGAEAFIPATRSIRRLAAAADDCRGCDLYKDATQAVFGRGPTPATVMLVGEVPGDVEDREGEPFVGPAGGLLGSALDEAGINIDATYLTNAVKHFRWEPADRGKRRIHKKPTVSQMRACAPWLQVELAVVKPRTIVALGATATQALLGSDARVTESRGHVLELPGRWGVEAVVIPTVHPSSVLRSRNRASDFRALVDDLKAATRTDS